MCNWVTMPYNKKKGGGGKNSKEKGKKKKSLSRRSRCGTTRSEASLQHQEVGSIPGPE